MVWYRRHTIAEDSKTNHLSNGKSFLNNYMIVMFWRLRAIASMFNRLCLCVFFFKLSLALSWPSRRSSGFSTGFRAGDVQARKHANNKRSYFLKTVLK